MHYFEKNENFSSKSGNSGVWLGTQSIIGCFYFTCFWRIFSQWGVSKKPPKLSQDQLFEETWKTIYSYASAAT